MKKPFFTRLAFRLSAITTVILVFLVVLQTLSTNRELKSDLVRNFANTSYNISEIIKSSTRYSMLQNSKKDINHILSDIGANSGIKSIKIYDKKGIVVFANSPKYLKETADKDAKSCLPCHQNQTPVTKLSFNDKVQIDNNPSANEIIIINPIENHTDCNKANCHEKGSDEPVLGILEIKISLNSVDAIVNQNVSTVISYAIIGAICFTLVLGFVIYRMVNKPLFIIKAGINELATGNLNYRLRVKSKNELGDVARQLNQMSGKLDTAYKEIKEWNTTLNKKVEDKTEELKVLYNQIIQVEKLASLGKLSATVAHELNNPLAGILNYSKLISKKLKKIQKEDEYSNILDFLKLIADESERCGRIVKDLLLFSHKNEDEAQEDNIVPTVQKSLLLIGHHLGMNKVTLEEYYSDEEIIVYCNSAKIQQALMSILINAIEAMPQGGKLQVRVSQEKRSAAIRVIDEGSGIDPKDLPNIFEPFFTTKDAIKGTGLGLSVAYGIITSFKGNIEVEKTSPYGTTFLITLPLKNSNG